VVAAADVGGSANLRVTDSLSKAVYVSEQVCIRWLSTGAHYTAKLAFSHQSLGCVLYKCAYYIRFFTASLNSGTISILSIISRHSCNGPEVVASFSTKNLRK